MKVNELLLLIYPVLLIILLLWQAKLPGKEEGFFNNPMQQDNSSALKGFAALGIILHHLVQKITEYGAVYKGPVTIFNWMGILFTTIFFFSSGYGLIVSKKKKEGYINSFLSSRYPNVLIPFYISNVIYLLSIGMYFGGVYTNLDRWLSLTGLRLINSNTWFIVEIIILYGVFYLAAKKTDDDKRIINTVLIFSVVMIAVSLLLCHDYHDSAARNPFQGEWWYNTTIFFYAGMFFAYNEERIVEYFKKNYKRLIIAVTVAFPAVFAVAIIVVENVGYYQEWEGHPGYLAKLITLIIQIIACAVFMLWLLLIGMKVRCSNTAIAYVGKISLEIYIIHDLVKQALIFNKRDGNDMIFLGMVLVISFALAVLLNLLDTLLIKLWKGRKAYFADVPDSYERRQEYNKVKRGYFLFRVCVALILAITTIFAAFDIYGLICTPYNEYHEELQSLKTAEIGDTVLFGTYETDYMNDVKERVSWTVLDKKDDSVLLVTKEVIERYSLNQEYENIDWSVSNTRKVLNDYLYDELFSKYEKKIVIETELESLRTNGDKIKTEDKVFLLSADEANKYFADDAARQGKATDAAKDNGVNVNGKDKGTWWWLRDVTPIEKRGYVVTSLGEISEKGEYVSVASGGIRPAVWVRIK